MPTARAICAPARRRSTASSRPTASSRVPGVLLIILTGVALGAASRTSRSLRTPWILWSLVLFGDLGSGVRDFVAPLQKKMLANVQRRHRPANWNQAGIRTRCRARWTVWGTVATGAPLIAVFLMVIKPV